MKKKVNYSSSTIDRRLGIDRRVSEHIEYFPERRCGYDQRNGIDRRGKQRV